MRYKRFIIRNFRGIKSTELEVDPLTTGNVFTLIGLNESGKTTVLQALALFYESINDYFSINDVLLHTTEISNFHTLIPKSEISNFTGSISIDALCELEGDDGKLLIAELDKAGYSVTKSFRQSITLSLTFEFSNSNISIQNNKNYRVDISTDLKVLPRTGRDRRELDVSQFPKAKMVVERFVSSIIPSIVYYPNFLLEFPDKIYLEQHLSEEIPSKFYRQFLQDVLTSIDPEQNIKSHIADRFRSGRENEREPLEATLRKISRSLSQVANVHISKIIGENRVFEIEISIPRYDKHKTLYAPLCAAPAAGDNHPLYVEVRIREGDSSYFIRERSLGFKWLFSFGVLTYYRVRRNDPAPPLFVFDEPASNLHQRAQQQIIEAIQDLVKQSSCLVIYSTHSHHLINLDWLDNAYIVENKAADYEAADIFSGRAADISAIIYKRFVVGKKIAMTYIQPILDKLEYQPSKLENIPDVIITEGKSDFFYIKYMNDVIIEGDEVNITPGTSASSFDPILRLYIGWNRNFVLILDDDEEGRRQKGRYAKSYPMHKKSILTLKDIDTKFDNNEIEDLFTLADKQNIVLKATGESTNGAPSKDSLYLATQLLLSKKEVAEISSEAKENFTLLISGLRKLLESKSLS